MLSVQTDESDPLIGSVVQERYRILSRMGEGGMGVVYLVEHTRIARRLALKVLDPAMGNNPIAVARFYREARAAAAIGDEHIVEVVDVGTLESGSPYILMEQLEGRDLRKELENVGAMPVERAATIAIQCCAALGEAHKKGIIHRDIKPENIFLTKRRDDSDFVKILDFGVSKFLDTTSENKDRFLTATGVAIGTPPYMSPEQVSNLRDIDPRTDVYALGVVLYEILTNQVPFWDTAYPDLLMKIVHDRPMPLKELRSDIPAALDKVVQRTLAKKREARYGSMDELADALARFTSSEASDVNHSDISYNSPVTPAVWESGTRRRNSRVSGKALLFGIGLALATIFAVLISVLANRFGETRQSVQSSFLAGSEPLQGLSAEPLSVKSSTQIASPSGNAAQPTATSKGALEEKSRKITSTPTRIQVPQRVNSNAKVPSTRPTPKIAQKPSKRRALRSRANTRSNRKTKPSPSRQNSEASVTREPTRPPKRAVTVRNHIRSRVNVTFKCAGSSKTVNVSSVSELSTAVPKRSCKITCAGVGHPLCPNRLDATRDFLDIR